MKTFNILSVLFSAIFISCEHDSEEFITKINNSNNNVIPVDSGHSAIVFNIYPSFYGSTNFNVTNTSTTWAFSQTTAGVRQVQVKAIENVGNTSKTVFLFMIIPKSANTESGAIKIDFLYPTSEAYNARLVLAYTEGSVQSPDFTSVSGSVTITKLSDTEVAGTFVGVVADILGHTISIMGGTFAGKF